MSEKTEAPTPRRLKKAREDGQLPRSRVLQGGTVTAASVATLVAFAPDSAERILSWTRGLLAQQQLDAQVALSSAVAVAAWVCVPPLSAALLASAAVTFATHGWSFTPKNAMPKLERLDPFAGLKKLFSLKQTGEVLRACLICVLIGWWAWRTVRGAAPLVIGAVRSEAGSTGFITPVLGMFRDLAIALAVLGVADYALARRRHLRDLRMSRQEVKQEHKDSEGDPRHKAQRKALHRQLSSRGPARGVQKATAVVVNPTHIAVALRYATDECEAPYLVAKGREGDALELRREAQRLGIPVVRDIPLARSLIHFDVGDEIPEELYRAAAGVLHAAAELREADPHPQKEMP